MGVQVANAGNGGEINSGIANTCTLKGNGTDNQVPVNIRVSTAQVSNKTQRR